MQTLYATESAEPPISIPQALRTLDSHLEQSRQLFTYLIFFLTEVASYAETDARLRSSKHLPSTADLNVNIKLAGNDLVWKTLEDAEYKQALKDFKVEYLLDHDLVKKIYQKLAESPEYIDYIALPSRDKRDEKKILEFIFSNLLLPNEDFIAHLEESFIHWDDDAEMMNLMVLNYLQKPSSYRFLELISKEKLVFGKELVKAAIEKKDYCMEMIIPKLKNWDAERIAQLDMILMRMGTCEFLYFETIPTKVTLNEYIDLAKDYSTPQSGHFVNGILDNIHKELSQADKLRKVDYKKQ